MDDSAIIDKLGGTSAVATLCELTPPSVSEWRHRGIPKPWRKYLAVIRPDAFQPERKKRK